LCLHEQDGIVDDLLLCPVSGERIKSVYIGKVKNIVKNINAAFVDIAPGKSCFLNLEECSDLIVLNRKREKSDLHQGDEIIVQIIKGEVKSKAPVVTGRLRLPRALKSEVIKKAKTRSCYSVLYSGKPEYLSFFDRQKLDSIDKITCSTEEIYDEVMGYVDGTELSEQLKSGVCLYSDDYPLNKLYKIDSLIEELTAKRIWLKSGANIIIEYTEAMTVIDVNTGKSIHSNADEHILDTNLEAAGEIFRQLKLRNLSGMILIDFINDNDENTLILTEQVKELASKDYITCEYIDITGLGIVEITRAKKNRPILELLRNNT